MCFISFRTIKFPLLFPVCLPSSTTYRVIHRGRRLTPSLTNDTQIHNRKQFPVYSIVHSTFSH
jgi:hypothetical protein